MYIRWMVPVVTAGLVWGCTSVSAPQVKLGSVPLASQSASMPSRAARVLDEQALQLAQVGQLSAALQLWDQAVLLAPEVARLHNNRGYVLLLLGRWDDAHRALTLAQTQPAPSVQAAANLALLDRLSRQAAAGPSTMEAGSQDQDPAFNHAVMDTTSPQLVVVGPQIYELRDVSPQQAPLAQPWTVDAKALAAVKAARLEVSNGVGVRLLAKRTSLKLAEQGVVTARLTNTPGFAQAVTAMQFPPQHAAAAQTLLALLPAGAAPQALSRGDHVRLVLGHDAAGRSVVAWLDGTLPRSTAQEVSTELAWIPVQEGWQWL